MTRIEVWHVIDGAVYRDEIDTPGTLAAGTVSAQIYAPDLPEAPCRGRVETPETTVLYGHALKIRIDDRGGAR